MVKARFILFTLCCSTSSAVQYILPKTEFEDANANNHFRELLKDIILLNEKRMDTLQKYTQMQTINVGENNLRIAPNEKNLKSMVIVYSPATNLRNPKFKDHTRNGLSALIENMVRKGLSIEVPDTVLKENSKSEISIKSDKNKYDNEENGSVNSSDESNVKSSHDKVSERSHEGENKAHNLRYRGCGKRATKDCEKACKEAIDDGCTRYTCRSKLKKYLKKQCKRVCKDRFK